MIATGLTCLASFLIGLAPQAKPKEPVQMHPKVDQKKADEAIRKGVAYLKGTNAGSGATLELLLWTYLHAGLTEEDSHVKELLAKMGIERPARTYNVSLQAMILEKLDRVKHQKRIFHCAQFLVDNQWDNGQWGYGAPTKLSEPPAGIPVVDRPKVATSGRKPRAAEPDAKLVRLRLPVIRQAHDPHSPGDNSNSQYAHLGLRACHDAGMIIPAETIARAEKSWREGQAGAAARTPDVATGPSPEGWRYSPANQEEKGPVSGSMTVGGLGALAILDYMRGKNWKADPDVLEAVRWVAANFSVTENPGKRSLHQYYYLYGLERAGVLYGTEYFGAHEWYPLGANYLLEHQEPDGSWVGEKGKAPIDTCFALLFLKRATRPLTDVASVDPHKAAGFMK
jgi:hypothetical protein